MNQIKLKDYPIELFEKAITKDSDAEKIKRPSIRYWPDVWRRLKQNKLAMSGLMVIVIMIIMAGIGPMINEYDYFVQNYDKINSHPNSEYWFGTDELGRDMFTRVWYGTRYSLFIGILATVIDVTIGII